MTLLEFLQTHDRFADNAGCKLKEIREGYACASMVVTKEHLNAGGVCQGGALFTLGDIALAAVVNSHGKLTFGTQNSIYFLKSGILGDTLTAEAFEVFNHHKMPYAEVKIKNQKDELICVLTGMAYRKEKDFIYDSLM